MFLCKEQVNLECILKLIDLVVLLIVIVILITSSIKMFFQFKKIKFENYVMLSGIVEVIMSIITTLLRYYIINEFINYLQLIISLFITRRFLRIYYKIEKKVEKNFFILFYLSLFLNTVLIISIIIMYFNDLNLNENDLQKGVLLRYTILLYSVFSLLASIWLFSVGLNIKTERQINENKIFNSFVKKEDTNNINEVINVTANEDIHLREKAMQLRKKQISLVIYGYFISDIIEFLFNIIRAIFLKDQFELLEFKVEITHIGPVILLNILNISNILPVVSNYLAFYYLVKDHFYITDQSNLDSKLILCSNSEDLDIGFKSIVTKDIDEYLN